MQGYQVSKVGLSKPDVLAKFITRKKHLVRICKEWPKERSGMLELSFEDRMSFLYLGNY